MAALELNRLHRTTLCHLVDKFETTLARTPTPGSVTPTRLEPNLSDKAQAGVFTNKFFCCLQTHWKGGDRGNESILNLFVKEFVKES